MLLLGNVLMVFLRWLFFACFLCTSLGLKTPIQSCDQNDMLALREFSGNLTNGSVVISWPNSTNCCQWEGVVCGSGSNGSIYNKVTRLILPRKGLRGSISGSLGRLDELRSLDLSCNDLQGVLPREFSRLKQLEILDLSHNLLAGNVSGVLSGLLSIQSLNISSNLFSGDVLEFGGFPRLSVFNISNNSFTGRFASPICKTSKGIQVLDLSMNHLGWWWMKALMLMMVMVI